MSQLKVDPELSRLPGLRPLNEQEYEALTNSIREIGCVSPIVVWKEEQCIIDGHHRYRICEAEGIPYRVKELSFPSRDHVIEWMLSLPSACRNETPGERELRLAELYKVRVRLRKEQPPPPPQDDASDEQDDDASRHASADDVAQQENVSPARVRRAARTASMLESLEKLGDAEIRQQFAEGKVSRAEVERRYKAAKSVWDQYEPEKPKKIAPEIPEHLQPVFECGKVFAELRSEVQALYRRIVSVYQNPVWAKHVAESTFASAKTACQQLLDGFKFVVPHTVCPACKGKSAAPSNKPVRCSTCAGRGYLTRAMADAHAKYAKEEAKHEGQTVSAAGD